MLSPVTIHAAQRYAVSMKDLDEENQTFFFKTWGCARKVYNLYVMTSQRLIFQQKRHLRISIRT